MLSKVWHRVFGTPLSVTERGVLAGGVMAVVVLISTIRDFATAVSLGAVMIIGFILLKLVVKFIA